MFEKITKMKQTCRLHGIGLVTVLRGHGHLSEKPTGPQVAGRGVSINLASRTG